MEDDSKINCIEEASLKPKFKDLSKIYVPKRKVETPLITLYDEKIFLNTGRLLKGEKVKNGITMTKDDWADFKGSVDKINNIILNSMN